MSLYVISISMAVLANVFYHLFAKMIDTSAHPLVSLTVTYAVATITCIVLSPFFVGSEFKNHLRSVNWASAALGLSIVLLELGFILAYRAGWKLNTAAIYANVTVGLLLLPIGILFFKESIDLSKALGFVLSIAGLYLLGKT